MAWKVESGGVSMLPQNCALSVQRDAAGWEASSPDPQLPGLGWPAYPSDEGGVGEGRSHVVELEIVHVVEELCRGLG